ncbi:MAG: CoA transferase [Deltaproteobacteria bacterium]|nr:CoA transferase [Deltaproteobacteria bacterium]MBW2421330.1 CoA transferase [Deltaproteobacteria bacterium]
MARPLDGIRVLDMTVWFQGPVCSQYLADFGAEVIHVERPVSGDPARGVRSIKALEIGDWNQYFLVINRNKKSLAVDLTSEGGQELIRGLAEKADVLLCNQGMKNLEKWGLTWEDLKQVNPRLIHATNTGHGQKGKVSKPSFDINVQALTGIMTRQGEPGQPPIYLGMGSGDAYGGIMSAFGIMMALLHRQKTGKGQAIDASLYGAQLFMGAPTLQPFLASRKEFYSLQRSRSEARNPLWNRYQASDKWLFLCQQNDDAGFAMLCGVLEKVLGKQGLSSDARFASPEKRSENSEALIAELDAAFASGDAARWTQGLSDAGIDASPIVTFKELSEDPQAWENDYLLKIGCGEVDREVEIRGLPITLSKTPGSVETLGPELGQDTEIILMEMLGMEWEQIEALKEQGVIP